MTTTGPTVKHTKATSRKGMTREAEQAYQSIARDEAPLGYITSWSIARGTLIEREKLLDLLGDYTLERYAPLAIKPKTAMRRALKEMDKDNLVRLMEDSPEYTIYGLVSERVVRDDEDSLPEFDYSTALRMVWYKAHGNDPDEALAFDDEDQGDRFRPLVAKYMASHTGGDLSQSLLRAIRANNSIAMRASGGMYFLPYTEAGCDALESLRCLMDDIAKLTPGYEQEGDPDTFLSAFALPDVEAHKHDMRLHVAHDLRADIKRLEDDLKEKEETQREAKRKRAEFGDETRATGVGVETVSKYLQITQDLRDKSLLYVDLLRFNADDIEARLGKAEQRLKRLLDNEEPF